MPQVPERADKRTQRLMELLERKAEQLCDEVFRRYGEAEGKFILHRAMYVADRRTNHKATEDADEPA